MLSHPLTVKLFQQIQKNNPNQPEFQQATLHFLESIDQHIDQSDLFDEGILSRFLEPDRLIQFKVVWEDDNHQVQVNRGYRVQYNNALGPYKGGLRFHPSVNASIIKFLGFDQTLKNALTDLLLGGAKGGSDFDPKGKSDAEIMRFSQAFIRNLSFYLGPDWDVPAGDIGVGHTEIGYMIGVLKNQRQSIDGILTGKPVGFGGSLIRKEATGYGLCYFVEAMLNHYYNTSFQHKKVVVSGSGNVAIYAAKKAIALGATVLAMSDSSGYIVDEKGIDIESIKEIKEVNKQRIKTYCDSHAHAKYIENGSIWDVACDVALPCATQNEVSLNDVETMKDYGVLLIGEGANMPLQADALEFVLANDMICSPGIASNAGGVAVSGLEMAQNASKLMWSKESVDGQLHAIMNNIFKEVLASATTYSNEKNLSLGAQLSGYLKVAKGIKIQGIL